MDARTIAEVLSREFPDTPRTRKGVHIEAHKLGISLWQPGYSAEDIGPLFGLPAYVVRTRWIKSGWLSTRAYQKDGGGVLWRISHAALETFVRCYPWAYRIDRMQPGHALTCLATVVQARHEWLELSKLAALLVASAALLRTAIRTNGVPHRRRFGYRRGLDLLVHVDDLDQLRVAIEGATASQKAEWTDLKRRQRKRVIEPPSPVARFGWADGRLRVVRRKGAA